MSSVLEIVIEARNRANAALTQISGQLEKLESQSTSFSGKMSAMSSAIGLAGGAFTAGITVPIAGATIGVIKAAAELEQYQVAFATMLGSASKATEFISQLQDFSAKTPFELPDVIQASRQLLAYGFASEEVTKQLETLGDISAGTGTNITDLTYLYGTLSVQGRVYARDLLQFTNRGIPALEALAQSLGKTKAEVMTMVSEGKIQFSDVQKAFEMLTGEGGRFNNMMANQSQTLLGMWSTFKDNFFIAMSQVGLKLVETFDLRSKMKGALEVLETVRTKLLSLIESNPQLVKIGAIFLAIAASIGPALILLSGFLAAMGGISAIVAGVAAAIAAAFAFLLSPIGLVGIAIAALVVAIREDWGGIGTFIMGIVNQFGQAFAVLREYFIAVVEDGDYMNDWLTHLPSFIRPVVEWVGYLTAKFIELGGVTGIFTILSTAVTNAFVSISSKVMQVVPEIVEAFGDLGTALEWIWNGQGNNVDWWWDITAVFTMLGLTSETTADKIANSLFYMGESTSAFIVKATEFKNDVVARFMQMYVFVVPIITAFAQNIWSMIPSIDEVKQSVVTFVNDIISRFMQMYAFVAPIITSFIMNVWSMIPSLDQVKQSVAAFRDEIVSRFLQVYAFVAPIITLVISTVSAMIPSFEQTKAAVVGFTDNVISKFVQMYAFVAPIVLTFIASIWALIPSFEQTKASAIAFKDSVIESFQAISSWVMTSFPLAFSIMNIKVTNAWEMLKESFNSSKATLTEVFNTLLEAWRSVVSYLGPTIQNVRRDFATFTASLPSLGTSFAELGKSILPVLQDIGMTIGVVFAILAPVAINIFSALMANLGPFIQGIVDALTIYFNAIHENFLLVVTAVKAVIDGDWAGAWNAAQQILSNSYNAIIAMGIALWGSVVAIFNFIFLSITNTLRQWGVDVDTYTGQVKMVWQLLWSSMKTTYETVAEALTAGWTSLKTWLTVTLPTSLNSMSFAFMVGWIAIKASVMNAMDPIIGVLKSMYDYLSTSLQAAVNGFKTFLSGITLTNPFSGIQGVLSTIMSNVEWLISHIPLIGGASAGAASGSATGHAMGTNYARGGLTLVGERGPELIALPRGSEVMNNRDTRSLLSGGSGQVNITINEPALYGGLTTSDLVDKIIEEIQRRM